MPKSVPRLTVCRSVVEVDISSDGSRQDDGRIGGGYSIENPAEHDPICKSYGIADTGSIYDAEGYALNKMARRMTLIGGPHKKIFIFVDNLGVVDSLFAPKPTDTCIIDCIIALNELARLREVQVSWVPSHMGITGNELADDEAEEGALGSECATDYIPSLKHIKNTLQHKISTEFKSRWHNSTRGKHLKLLLDKCSTPPNILPFSRNKKMRSLWAKIHTGGRGPWRSNLGHSPCHFCQNAGLGIHDETLSHFFDCRANPLKNTARQKLVRPFLFFFFPCSKSPSFFFSFLSLFFY